MQEVRLQAIGSQDLCWEWVKSCFALLGGRSWTLLIWTPLYSDILDLKLQEASVLSFSFQVEQPHFLATHKVSSFDSLKLYCSFLLLPAPAASFLPLYSLYL